MNPAHGKYQVLPPLSPEAYEALKSDIQEHGVLVPIEFVREDDGSLCVIDGHNRLAICIELGIKDYPSVVRINLGNEAEKRAYARRINLVRRHLGSSAKRELIKAQLVETPTHSDRMIAAMLGVTNKTVAVQRKFLEETDVIPRALQRLGLDGKSRKNAEPIKPMSVWNPSAQESRLIKNPEIIAKMEASGVSPVIANRRIKQQRKAERKNTPFKLTESDITVFQADVRSGLPQIADKSIDAILTDAPYAKRYGQDIFEAVSLVASRVLKPGGILLCMSGQSNLPTIMAGLSAHMQYHWTLAYITSRGAPPLHWMKVTTLYKPILWYTRKGEPYKGDLVPDIIHTPPVGDDRNFHEHGQSVAGFRELVERFTYPSDTILDLFCGGGTTGLAAIQSPGRKFIGCDIEITHVETARKRILDALREEYGE